jgi:hypothetical protein
MDLIAVHIILGEQGESFVAVRQGGDDANLAACLVGHLLKETQGRGVVPAWRA